MSGTVLTIYFQNNKPLLPARSICHRRAMTYNWHTCIILLVDVPQINDFISTVLVITLTTLITKIIYDFC